MKTIQASVLLVLATSALAQYAAGPSSATSSAAAPVTTTGSITAATQTVSVGTGGLVFNPNSVKAAVGSVLEFHFSTSKVHSVAQSTFDAPCISSGSSGIYSGFPSSDDVFQVTINSTDPLWLYCSQVTHCQRGMSMVVNPASSGSQSLSAYQAAAKSVSGSTAPASVQGGIVVAASSLNKTSTSTSTSSGSPSGSSAAPSPSSTSSTAAAPTVAVFQVGGAAVLLAAAGWMV